MLYNLPKQYVSQFVTAGNAIVTIESGNTGKRYTYRIQKSKDGRVYFVGLLTGSNNDSNYSYLCYFNNVNAIKFSKKSCFSADAEPSVAFTYFMKHLKNVPEKLHVYHSCRCGRCGRTLTTPESIERGLGPECAGLVG